jgi:tetratricopeptide (TPR) repeat protein
MTMQHISDAVLGMYALEPSLVPNRTGVEAHLAVCHDCSSSLGAIRMFDAALTEVDAWPANAEDAGHSAAVEQLRAFASRCAEEDRDAVRLLAEYEEPDAAPRFVWADVPGKPEYRTGGIARLLCQRANAMCTRKPLYALALAEAAVRISADLPDATYPRSTIHELRGEAWKEQANALVSLGRFDEALAALAYAEAEYRQLPHDGLGLVAVTYVRAFILYEQEQFDAADRLARESAEVALHLGSTGRCMLALHLQGEIRLRRSDFRGAIELFDRVLRYGEETRDRAWIAREMRALGICHIELIDTVEASRHLQASLRLSIEMHSAVEVTRTQWAIARLTFLQGNPEDAVRRLRAVVGELIREGMLTDAALAAVHLAEMLHATNRSSEIPKILAGVVQTFIAAGKLSGALAALAYVKEVSTAGTMTPAVFSYVRKFIARADHQPGLLFVPPELEPPV